MLKKAVPLSSLPIGKPIAQNIFDERDRLLLREGSILSAEFIQRLKSNDIDSVFIAMEVNTKPEEDKPKPIAKPTLTNYHTLYNELLYEQNRIELRGYYKKPIQKEFLTKVNGLIALLKIDLDSSLNFFMDIKSSPTEYQYNKHHTNTGILAVLISSWLDLDNNLIKEATIASMLHDIGETRISPKILKKPGKLTESELNIVKTHPVIGVEILSKTDWINNKELYGVLTHHERLNGTGYPYKLLGSKIIIHARIAAVASIFNAATTNRPYTKAKNILEVMLELRNRSYGELDSKVTRILYNKLADYIEKNNKTILLNNGDKGHLKRLNKQETRLFIYGENDVYNLDDANCPKIISISK